MPNLLRLLPLAGLGVALLVSAGAPAAAQPEEPGPKAPAAAPASSLPAPGAVAAELDRLMEKSWAAGEVSPQPLASDTEFLRRLHLDVTGSVPDEETVRAFLASQAPDKRAQAIRAVIRSDAYPRTLALRWAYLLVGREYLLKSMQYAQAQQAQAAMERAAGGEPSMSGPSPAPSMGPSMGGSMSDGEYDASTDGPVPPLVGWLESQLQDGKPWDQVVREIITAEGAIDENPAGHYMVRYLKDGKAEELAGSSMRVFNGLQIQCAQCHDHPYTAWTQRDFYGVAAFYARAAQRREPEGTRPNGKKVKGPYIVFERQNDLQIRIPAPEGERGGLVLPRFLTGEVIRPGTGINRRAELARLITAPTNPWFAKAIVNRTWSFLFGRGIIDPVDDLETKDYPHPDVLTRLEADFRQSGHDMRRLVEVIASTRAYQLSSEGSEDTREAQLAVFARAPMRMLSAEQIFYSVLEATGAEDIRTNDRRARQRLERVKFALLRKFLQTFDNDEGNEQVDEGTIPQALLLLNGPLTNDAIRPRVGHPLYDRLFRMRDHDERIDVIYLRALGRLPTQDERAAVREVVASDEARTAAGQAQVYADLVWSLLNSGEFALNH